MNPASKATGAAATLATALVVTVGWLLDLYGIKIPDMVTQVWIGALTFGFGWLLHGDNKAP